VTNIGAPVRPALVWFRQDLRVQDNRALNAALARGGAVVPVYIHDDAGEGDWSAGGASRWWLHQSLSALDASLRRLGSRLILGQGDSATLLRSLVRTTGAAAIYWNRRYEPASVARDAQTAEQFAAEGISVETFNSALLREPAEIANKQGQPFKIFTPYWRHALTLPVAAPARFPARVLPGPEGWPESLPLAELNLLPRIRWDAGFSEVWQPGEVGAAKSLRQFVTREMEHYADERNRPDREGTSRLSPHLHFGEIGPRQVWAAVQEAGRETGVFPPSRGAGVFLGEIGWREFASHGLFYSPEAPVRPMRREFADFPWTLDPGGRILAAWQRGRTGYPIVDAGMRQLWHTGWMHNRVRMIVASFLVKHLRLSWVHGARWFWDTLVDADLANNTLGWQWSAGSGFDAAPYFRIFAPVLQGRKFDPEGDYVRRWVPELARMSADWIHEPWQAPAGELTAAGVRLGEHYPRPIVDHAEARAAALAAYRQLRTGADK